MEDKCSFKTNENLDYCASRLGHYRLNSQGVPDGVLIMKYITPQQYVDNLHKVVGDVIANDLTVGDTSSPPTRYQQHLMARLMNAVGFCFTKWKGLINERKTIIRQRVDGPEDDENIKEVTC